MTTQSVNPDPEVGAGELAVTGLTSQMIACLLMGVIMFGVVVSAAYILIRRSVAPQTTAVTAQQPAPAPVQARQALPPAPAPAPILVQQAPPPVPAPVAAPAQPQSLTITAAETSGKTFLQVGAIERPAVPRFLEGLTAKGFSPRIAEGPTTESARILIGPLDGAALTATKAKLTEAGVPSFPKTYPR